MKKQRYSKYELLRIVSMFMIILWHILIHGHVLENTTGMVHILLQILMFFLIVHVNSFVLVTGYYQCKSSFKFSKLISLNNAAWFYRIIIMIVLLFFNIISVNKIEILKTAFPIDLSLYWFIDTYLILYSLSPFLNILISKMDKSTFQKLLVVLFILFSLLPSFTEQEAFYNNRGYSITNFVLLYFIGAYLRNYPIKFFEFYKINSDKLKKLIFGFIFISLAVANCTMFFFGIYISGASNIATKVGEIIRGMALSYDNPFVILATVAYFLWFGCLHIKSKFINKLSSLVFGIYLIHDNIYIRENLYQLFNLKVGQPIYGYTIILKIFAIALIIFVACAIIEWVRQIIFKLIYDLSISNRIRIKFKNYIQEIKTRQPLLENENET